MSAKPTGDYKEYLIADLRYPLYREAYLRAMSGLQGKALRLAMQDVAEAVDTDPYPYGNAEHKGRRPCV